MARSIEKYWFHPGKDFKKYCDQIVKFWNDEKEKRKFLKDPKGYLECEGFDFPKGITVGVALNSADLILKNDPPAVILPLPQKPKEAGITRDEDSAAGLVTICVGFRS